MISPHLKVSTITKIPYFFIFFSQKCWHFSFLECLCNVEGSETAACDETSGKCTCKSNVIGDKCTECASEFYGFPDCQCKYWETTLISG